MKPFVAAVPTAEVTARMSEPALSPLTALPVPVGSRPPARATTRP